jgi:2-phospho-L-lactate guanylyltransferase (CobY/MobA/RfbA family)
MYMLIQWLAELSRHILQINVVSPDSNVSRPSAPLQFVTRCHFSLNQTILENGSTPHPPLPNPA